MKRTSLNSTASRLLLSVALAGFLATVPLAAQAQGNPTEPTPCQIRTVTATDASGNPYPITLTMCPKVEEFGP